MTCDRADFLWVIHNCNNVQRKATTDFDGKFIDTVKRLDSQIVGPDRPQLQLIYSAVVDDSDPSTSD